MKASDLFIKCLEYEGVEYIFGIPGEEIYTFKIILEFLLFILFDDNSIV
jgi:acetolactate synthase I/II/III large subunit